MGFRGSKVQILSSRPVQMISKNSEKNEGEPAKAGSPFALCGFLQPDLITLDFCFPQNTLVTPSMKPSHSRPGLRIFVILFCWHRVMSPEQEA